MRELSRNRVSQDRLDAIEQALLGETVQPSESRLDAIERALMGEGAPSAAPAVTERVSSPLPLEPSPAPSVEELKTMEYEGIPVTGRREPMFVPAPVLPVGGAITRPVQEPWSLPTDIAEAAFHLAKGAIGYLPSKAEELIRLGIGTAKGMTPEELEEFAGEAGSWLGPGPATSTAQVVERALGPIFAFPGEVVRGEKIKTPPGPPSPRAGAFQATYERLQKEARARGEEVPPALISEETSQKIGVWANSIFTTALELYGFKQLHNVFQGAKSKLKIKKRRAKMTREEYEAIAEELRKQADAELETRLRETERKEREAKNERVRQEQLGERERLQRLQEELPKSKEEPPVEEPAAVKMMITAAEKAELRERGYTEEQIRKMKPQEAEAILTEEPTAPAAPETPVFLAWKETTNPDKPYVAYYKVGDKILPGITLRGMGLEIPETPPSPLAKAKVGEKPDRFRWDKVETPYGTVRLGVGRIPVGKKSARFRAIRERVDQGAKFEGPVVEKNGLTYIKLDKMEANFGPHPSEIRDLAELILEKPEFHGKEAVEWASRGVPLEAEYTVVKPPEIPAFKTTNEAVEFGKTATPEQIARMKELAEEHRRLAKEAREAGDSDTAMAHAVSAQFLREAVEQPKLPGEAVPEEPKFGKGEPKEKTLITLEEIKAEAEKAVADAKDLLEARYLVQEIITRYDEHPRIGFKDEIELEAYHEWGDNLMGKINDACRKAGLIEQAPDAPVEAVIEGKRSSFEDPTGTGGFESRKSAEFYKLGFPEVGRVVENPYAKGKFVFERGGDVELYSGFPVDKVVDLLRFKKKKAEARKAETPVERGLRPGDVVYIRPTRVLDREFTGVNSSVLDGWLEKLDGVDLYDTKATVRRIRSVMEEQFGREALSKFNQALASIGEDQWHYALQYAAEEVGIARGPKLFEPASDVARKMSAEDLQRMKETGQELSVLALGETKGVDFEMFLQEMDLRDVYQWSAKWESLIKERKDILRKYRRGEVVRPPEFLSSSGMGEFQRMYENFAERFRKRAKDEGRKITEAASETLDRGEIVSQRKIKGRLRPPVYRAELEILKEANKLPQTVFHRGFENPIRTFNEAGGEAMLDLTTHPYHAREKGAMILARKWTKSRRELKRGVTKKEADRITRYAIGKQEFGQEKLEFMGRGMVKELTPKEAEVYEALRARFESHYRQANAVRKYLGKEPLPYVEDYFTFIRNMSWLERAGFEPMQMPSDILNAHFIKMGSTPFPFEKPRSRTAYRLEMDPFHVLEAYENTLARYIQLSPLVAKLREYQATMIDPETGKKFNLMNENPVLATALQSWANAIGGMKSPSFKLPLAIEKGMARVNNNLVASILGANVRSAMIQVTALRNTAVEIGPQYTMRGILSLVDPARRNFALQKSKVLLQRTYDVAVEDALRGIRAGKVGEVQRFGTRLAMKPLQILDMETAKATWQGAYDYAINKKGMAGRRAVNFADDVVTRTQASGMIGDLAPIQRPVVGRFLTLFQTFTINDWDFLVKDVVGVRNRGINSGKAFRKAMSYVAATTLFNILLEDVLHINSPFPTPIRAFKESLERGDEIPSLAWNTAKEFIEPIPMIGAARYGKGPFGPGGELILETVKGISVDPQAPAWWELGGKWIGLPGTAQVGKMTSARKRGETPYGQVVGTYTPPKKKTPSGFGGMGGMGELGGGL